MAHRSMNLVGWFLALGLMSACAHQVVSPSAEAQAESQQALDAAKKAQERANAKQMEADRAQLEVQDLHQKLAQAEARAEKARREAREAQAEARRVTEEAQATARQSQVRALAAQRQQQQAAGTPQRVSGVITHASKSRVTIQPFGESPMELRTSDSTDITLDGQVVATQDLPEGAEVRVDFVPGRPLPIAKKIEAHSAPTQK